MSALILTNYLDQILVIWYRMSEIQSSSFYMELLFPTFWCLINDINYIYTCVIFLPFYKMFMSRLKPSPNCFIHSAVLQNRIVIAYQPLCSAQVSVLDWIQKKTGSVHLYSLVNSYVHFLYFYFFKYHIHNFWSIKSMTCNSVNNYADSCLVGSW